MGYRPRALRDAFVKDAIQPGVLVTVLRALVEVGVGVRFPGPGRVALGRRCGFLLLLLRVPEPKRRKDRKEERNGNFRLYIL